MAMAWHQLEIGKDKASLINVRPSRFGGVEQVRIVAHEIYLGIYAVRRPRGGYGMVYRQGDDWEATSSWGSYRTSSFPAALIEAAWGRRVYRSLQEAREDYSAGIMTP